MEFNMETEEFSKIMRNIELSSRYKSIVRNPKVLINYMILNIGFSYSALPVLWSNWNRKIKIDEEIKPGTEATLYRDFWF